MTDNALRHEGVVDPPDTTARAVVDFNRKLLDSNEFLTPLVPLRDGLTVTFLSST